MSLEGGYSETADRQLDALEVGPDPDPYHAVLYACELVFGAPQHVQANSTAVMTGSGVVFRLPVLGFPPYKVFWSSDGPRVEAVFPHP